TRRSTKPPRILSFGTPSSHSANGGPSCRPTEPSCRPTDPRDGARPLLHVPPTAVECVDVVGHLFRRAGPDPGLLRTRLAAATATQRARAAGGGSCFRRARASLSPRGLEHAGELLQAL